MGLKVFDLRHPGELWCVRDCHRGGHRIAILRRANYFVALAAGFFATSVAAMASSLNLAR